MYQINVTFYLFTFGFLLNKCMPLLLQLLEAFECTLTMTHKFPVFLRYGDHRNHSVSSVHYLNLPKQQISSMKRNGLLQWYHLVLLGLTASLNLFLFHSIDFHIWGSQLYRLRLAHELVFKLQLILRVCFTVPLSNFRSSTSWMWYQQVYIIYLGQNQNLDSELTSGLHTRLLLNVFGRYAFSLDQFKHTAFIGKFLNL